MSLFSFKGSTRRIPYAVGSLAAFSSQYLAVAVAFRLYDQAPNMDWRFYVMPLRSVVYLRQQTSFMLMLGLAYLLIVGWMLAALAFRRAADANVNAWITALAMVPAVQIPVILFLCLVPSRPGGSPLPVADDAGPQDSGWPAPVQGLIAGMALTLFAVAVGALVFGTYGFGMFVLSPFIIGATTAYLANRKQDIGAANTMSLVAAATALGGIALIAVALEGAVCILLASPLGFVGALVGGVFGRSVALFRRRSPRKALSTVALLPIVFASESILPVSTTFDAYQTIDIGAPPEQVWSAITHMDRMDDDLALPFRLGMAYPVRGDVIGEGVGALRRGEFSTGIAWEQVTEWVPNRKLAFAVVNDVPAMHELSPYRQVHAPHVIGYFRTAEMSFELVPLPDGHTEIIARSSHELRLDPVLYWLPMAQWAVHANDARVLANVRRQAEHATASALPP